MSIEAMKQALKVLEQGVSPSPGWVPDHEDAITAIREALAQPEQEPVAWMVKAHGLLQRLSRRADVADEIACQYRKDDPKADMFPLYTAPPQRKPLTDEEIAAGRRAPWGRGLSLDAFKAGVRFAEASHGVKGKA